MRRVSFRKKMRPGMLAGAHLHMEHGAALPIRERAADERSSVSKPQELEKFM
jgi:hypothetical protein